MVSHLVIADSILFLLIHSFEKNGTICCSYCMRVSRASNTPLLLIQACIDCLPLQTGHRLSVRLRNCPCSARNDLC